MPNRAEHNTTTKGTTLDASKLTAEQINYICQDFMEPQLARAKSIRAKSETGSLYANVCDEQIKKIADIFVSVGYWQARKGN
jgi:hypothetical protein